MKKLLKFLVLPILILSTNVVTFAGNPSLKENKQAIDKTNSSFNNDLFSGIGSYVYNFVFAGGPRGITPTLSINYNTASVDYLNDAGYGFTFGVQSIFRATRKGNDKLYSLDEFSIHADFSTNELIKVGTGLYNGTNNNDLNTYSFANDNWIVKDTKGNTYYFGNSDADKQIHPTTNKTFRWTLSKKIDSFGNEIRYIYDKEYNNIYLKEIDYAYLSGQNPLYKIKINYLAKVFSTESYLYGFKMENHRLLSELVQQTLVNGTYADTKRYELSYIDSNTVFPKLVEIKEIAGNTLKPSTKFEYYSSGIGMNLMSKIDNGRGGNTKLEYKSSTAYKNTTVPYVLKTLYKVTYSDSVTNLSYSNTYDYYGGNFYFDPINIFQRGYTGFGKVRILDDDGSYKDVYFHQSDSDKNNPQNAVLGEFEDHISKKGRIYREEEFDNNGTLYTTKITKWIKQSKGNGIYFVLPENVVDIQWNASGSYVASAEGYEYDAYGNVLKNTKYGQVSANTQNGTFTDVGNDAVYYQFRYAADSSHIFVNEKCEEWFVDKDDKKYFDIKYTYDNLGDCEISHGLMTKKESYLSSENRFITEQFAYTNGILTQKTDPLGNSTRYTYDDYGLFSIVVTNPKGWSEYTEYNYSIQKPIKVTNVNGVQTNFVYDAFGRELQKSVVDPATQDGVVLEKTILNESVLPNYKDSQIYADGSHYTTMRVYFDGYGKDIETKSSSKYTDAFSTSKTRYDKDGNKAFVTYPKFEDSLDYTPIASTEKGNSLAYDALGRLISQVNKAGETIFTYDLLKTTQTDQKGIQKSLYKDYFGNLIKVEEYNGSDIYTTVYNYVLGDKLSKITDANGNIRNIKYDSLGRTIKMEDAHAPSYTNFGFVTYTYNDNSLVVQKKTLSDDTISYQYDALGRLLSETIGNKVNIINYDSGVYATGLMSSTLTSGYSEQYTYNYLGQKIEDKKIYASGTYVFGYTYNLAGDITKIIYPDDSMVEYGYTRTFLDKVKYNGQEMVSEIEYTGNNKPSKTTYANGMVTEDTLDYSYGYRIVGRKSYQGATIYQNLIYTFDSVGNIVSITNAADNALNKQSRYGYDDLGRIVGVNYTGADNDYSSYTFAYDAVGNIVSNSAVGDYSYDGGTNPYVMTQVGNTAFVYDTNGNISQETISGNIQNYVYTPKQELVHFDSSGVQTSYLYDVSAKRVVKKSVFPDVTDETKYVGDLYEENTYIALGDSGSVIISKNKYIFAGGVKIATIKQKNTDPEEVIYTLEDHLGGASIDISSDGAVLQMSDYLPFGGERVLVRGTGYVNNYLFAGKEKDEESSLQYFEARYYSPEYGRFYSQDKVFWELGQTERGKKTLSDPQSLNAYSYARNNPVIYSDPSGEYLRIPFVVLGAVLMFEYAPIIISEYAPVAIEYAPVSIEYASMISRSQVANSMVVGATNVLSYALVQSQAVVQNVSNYLSQATDKSGVGENNGSSSQGSSSSSSSDVGNGKKINEINKEFNPTNQDKRFNESIKKMDEFAKNNGYDNFHTIKDSFRLGKDYDAYFTENGEMYFKRMAKIKGEYYDPIPTGIFK